MVSGEPDLKVAILKISIYCVLLHRRSTQFLSILCYNKLGKYDIRRISDMKINISSKNYPMSEKLSNYIEK